jgi:hypothetical protein
VSASLTTPVLAVVLTKACSATSLGMMSDEEKKVQRIEDIRNLLF